MHIIYKQTEALDGIRLSIKFNKRQPHEPVVLCQHSKQVSKETLDKFCEIFTVSPLDQKRFKQTPSASMLLHFIEKLPELKSSYSKSMIEELMARGYNLKTFNVESCLSGTPYKKRIGRQTAGRLKCLYTKDKEDGYGYDTICWWRVPCSKRDVNMLFDYLSGPGFFREGIHKDLENMGLNPKSFFLTIDHHDKPKKAKS